MERGARSAMADDGRTETIEVVLDELEATRRALDMGKEGDLVVVCVDHANDVWKELQRRQHGGAAGTPAMTAVTMLADEGAPNLEVEA